MSAPEPSPAEQAVIDRFGIFDEETRDDREPKPCPRCGQMCKYDGWGHVHPTGLGIGSCSP